MKNLIKNLILFLIIGASVNSAFCYVLSSQELKSEVSYKVNKEIDTLLKNYNVERKTIISGVPYEKITTTETKKPTIELWSQNPSFSQNMYKRVMIKDSQGNTLKSFPINIRTYIYKDVLTAIENIPYNSSINSSNTKLERKEISRYLDNTYSSPINDYVAKRNFQKGSIILSNYVKTKSSILKNSSIDVVFESNNLNIKVRGKALKEGSIGDRILVRTDKYNKTYTGTVRNQNEVVVRI